MPDESACAEFERAQRLGVGFVDAEMVAPRARHRDVIVFLLERELRRCQHRLHPRESRQKRRAIRHHDADCTAKFLRLSDRQVKLRAAGIDPHVLRAGHQVRIAREPERRNVELRRDDLIGDAEIDVLEVSDVADILGRAVEGFMHDRLSGKISSCRRVCAH